MSPVSSKSATLSLSSIKVSHRYDPSNNAFTGPWPDIESISSLQVHEACVALLGQPGDAAAAASRRFYLVFFPAQFNSSAMIFWQISGTGISSHLAESMHECLDSISPAPVLDQVEESELFRELANAETNEILCTRISNLLKRASISLIKAPASPSNFFLYPTGMAVIYELNMLLQIWRPEQNIVFCFPYKQAHLETARDVRQGSQIL